MKGELRYCIDYVKPNCPYRDNGVLNVRHFRTLSEEEASNVLTIIKGCGCKLIALYKGNVQDGKLEEWSPLPMIVNEKEDFYVDGEFDSYSHIVGYISSAFIHYYDNNIPKGKMCLSNMECADIEKAFREQDWAKIERYIKKLGKAVKDMADSICWTPPKGCIIQQNIIKEENKMEEKKTLEELAQPLRNWLVEHDDEVPSSKIVIDKYSVVVIQEIMGGSLNKAIEEQ